jgi:hypothetical protein
MPVICLQTPIQFFLFAVATVVCFVIDCYNEGVRSVNFRRIIEKNTSCLIKISQNAIFMIACDINTEASC